VISSASSGPAATVSPAVSPVKGPVAQIGANAAGMPGVGSSGTVEGQADVMEEKTPAEAVLCDHCGRTASNGLTCIGACVADSGY